MDVAVTCATQATLAQSGSLTGGLALYDLTGDGLLDIVVTTLDGVCYMQAANASMFVVRPIEQAITGGVSTPLATGALLGDPGMTQVRVCVNAARIHMLLLKG